MPGCSMSAMSTLNWRMKSTAASPRCPGRAHAPPSDDDLALGCCSGDGGHIQVVGDDAQAPVVQQRCGNGLGGGADVQDQ